MSCSSSEWPNYQHQISPYEHTSTLTTNVTPPANYSILSSNNPNESKPAKRKSRASKKAPITILKAEVSDFRALVQQLTGRPNVPIGVGAYKGPLNINFGERDEEGDQVGLISSRMLPFGHNTSHNYQHVYKQKPTQNHHHHHHQGFVGHEDHMMASRRSSLSSVAPTSTTKEGLDDDFEVDDICFEELAWLASSNGTTNGDI